MESTRDHEIESEKQQQKIRVLFLLLRALAVWISLPAGSENAVAWDLSSRDIKTRMHVYISFVMFYKSDPRWYLRLIVSFLMFHLLFSCLSSLVKAIPRHCIAHPYCARFSRHKRVHVNNERNFPQAKLDSEINVRFLLNEHGDLYFLLLNNSVHIIPFNLTKKKTSLRKKRYRWKRRAQKRYSGMQKRTAKTTASGMQFTSTSF